MGGVGIGVGVEKAIAVGVVPVNAERLSSEDVRDRWQTIIRLCSQDMMDVGGIGKVGGLVGNMAGHWIGLVSAGEALIERGRLDHSFICKLFVGRRNDREAWRGTLFG